MPRQSFSLTQPNDEWLNSMVERQEYSNKTEIVNDLIRRARREEAERDAIRAKLIRAEQSGFVDKTPEEMLQGFKQRARRDGKL